MGPAHVGLAQVLYERDELTAALDHATRGVTLCQQLAFTAARPGCRGQDPARTVTRPGPCRRWARPDGSG